MEKQIILEKESIALFRCRICGRDIRTSEEIRLGKRLLCTKCGARLVIFAVPTFLEKIKLFLRVGTWFIIEEPKEENFETFDIPYPTVEGNGK